MLVLQAIYIVFAIILAKLNANIIAKGRTIWHFGNGLIHFTVAVFASVIWWWPIGIAVLCNTNVFFNSFLNYFRFGRINYISSTPKSVIDKWEIKLFGHDFYLPRMMYLLISLSINCLYFVVNQ